MAYEKMKLAAKLGVGVGRMLQLTPEQVGKRPGCLKEIDKRAGIYEVVKPIEFKSGEVIGVELREVPKADYPALGVKGKPVTKPVGTKAAPAGASTGSAAGKAKSEKPKETDAGDAPVGEGKKTIDVTA